MRHISNLIFAFVWFAAVGSACATVSIGTQPPAILALGRGEPGTLSVTATGSGTLSYQWLRNQTEIPGANSASLLLPEVTSANAGVYQCRITDDDGTTASYLTRVSLRGKPVGWNGAQMIELTQWPTDTVAVAIAEGGGARAQHVLTAQGTVFSGFRNSSTALAPWTHPSPEAFNLVAVSGSTDYLMTLRNDGKVAQQRSYDYGSMIGPPGPPPPPAVHPAIANLRTVAISMSRVGEALALTETGDVYCWTPSFAVPPDTPPVLSDVRMITSGGTHHLALKKDGTVLGLGTISEAAVQIPSGLTDVVALAAGDATNFALKADGSVMAWGPTMEVQVVFQGAVAISAADHYAYFLKADGSSSRWQDGTLALGNGTEEMLRTNPAETAYLYAASRSVYLYHDLGLRADGLRLNKVPQAVSLRQGDPLRLEVALVSNYTASYQWARDGEPIPGATGAVFEIAMALPTDAGDYTVTATAADGTATTTPATVTVAPAPYFTLQPAPTLDCLAGQAAQLHVETVTAGTAQYQWFLNGRPLAGATRADLSLPAFDPAVQSGVYLLRVTDDTGENFSHRTLLAVPGGVQGWRAGQVSTLASNVEDAPVMALSQGDPHFLVRKGGVVDTLSSSSTSIVLIGGIQTTSWWSSSVTAAGLGPVVQAAARGSKCLALQHNGSVCGWTPASGGLSFSGGIFFPTFPFLPIFPPNQALDVPVPANATRDVLAVSLGGTEALALKVDGSVVQWDAGTGVETVPPARAAGLVAISSGLDHHLGLKADGTVAAWGDNAEGERAVPASLTEVAAVAAGDNFSLALKKDGTVVAWGRNADGECDVPAGLTQVVAISGSGGTAMATLKNGGVVVWGANQDLKEVPASALNMNCAMTYRKDATQQGVGIIPYANPVFVLQPEAQTVMNGDPVTFSASATASPSVTSYSWYRDGTLLGSGTVTGAVSTFAIPAASVSMAGNITVVASNGVGTATSQTVALTVIPAPVISAQSSGFSSHLPNTSGTLSVTATSSGSGALSYQWFRDGFEVPGATAASLAVNNTASPGLYQLRISDDQGTRHSRLMPVGLSLWLDAWRNGASALPAPLAPQISLSSGEAAYALGADGYLTRISIPSSLNNGQSWPAGATPPPLPQSAPNGVWVRAAARGSRGMGLRSDGVVAAWEADANGQASHSLLVPSTARDAVALSMSHQEGLALLRGGTVLRWNLADGTVLPAPVGTVKSICSGKDHHLLLMLDGSVASLGNDSDGECMVPPELTHVQAVAAGDDFSLALLADGMVTAWGSNSAGQTTVPANLGGVQSISAAQHSAFAVKADGTVSCWGNHGSGQAGWPDFRSVPDSITPAVVAGLYGNGISTVAVTLARPSVPVITQQPQNIQSTAGKYVTLTVGVRSRPAVTSYQWRLNGSSYTTTGVPQLQVYASAGSAGTFRVMASNTYLPGGAPSVTSEPATLTIVTAPAIITQPASLSLAPGAGGDLSVAGSSTTGELSYQWQRNGRPVAGATSATLHLDSITPATEGVYRVLLTNSIGTTKSSLVKVTSRYQTVAWDTGLGEWEQEGSTVVGDWSSGEPFYVYDIDKGYFEPRGVRPSKADSHVRTSAMLTYASGIYGVRMACRGNRILCVRPDGMLDFQEFTSPYSTTSMSIPGFNGGALDAQMDKSGRALILLDTGALLWSSLPNGAAATTAPTVTDAIAISCGKDHHLALRANGTVVAFGDNSTGECAVPTDLANVVQISAGDDFSLALKADGNVVAWGTNSRGETNVPAGLANVTRISAAGPQAMAVHANGSLSRWGESFGGFAQKQPPASALPLRQITLVQTAEGSYGFPVGLTEVKKPEIIDVPQSLTVQPGAALSLSVSVRSRLAVSYQWRKNGSIIPGATSPLYLVASATAGDAGSYTVDVTSLGGTTTPAPSVVTIGTGDLVILTQPPPTLPLIPGTSGTLSVTASSTLPISYQWHLGTKAIPEATQNTLNVGPLTRETTGVYHCRVSTSADACWSTMTLAAHPGYLTGWTTSGSALNTATRPTDVRLLALGKGHCNLAIDHSGALQPIRFTSSTDLYFSPQQKYVCAAASVDNSYINFAVVGTDGVVRAGRISYGYIITRSITGPAITEGTVDIEFAGDKLYCLRRDGLVVEWDLSSLAYSQFTMSTSLTPLQDVAALAVTSGEIVSLTRDATLNHKGTANSNYSRLPGTAGRFVAIRGYGSFFAAFDDSGKMYRWGNSPTADGLGHTGISGITGTGSQWFYSDDDGNTRANTDTDFRSYFNPGLPALPTTAPLLQMGVNENRLLMIRRYEAPTVTVASTDPRNIAQGDAVWLSPTVSTGGDVAWEWWHNGAVVGTDSQLAINGFDAQHAGEYVLRGVSMGGEVQSTPMVLTLAASGPQFTEQPADQNVGVNSNVTLRAAATGTQTIDWQWYRNGILIPGATSPTFSFTATAATAGRYQARAGNATDGFVWGRNAFVRIIGTYAEWGRRSVENSTPAVETALGTYNGLRLLQDGTLTKAGTFNTAAIAPEDTTNIRAVFARGKHLASLTKDNKVTEWEAFASLTYDFSYTPSYTRAEGPPIVQLALGDRHTLALRQDGSLSTWSFANNYGSSAAYGVLDLPADLADVAQVAAGRDHSVALRRDGTVIAWGRNDLGQCNVPAGLNNVVQISASQHYTVALRADGSLVAWGDVAPGTPVAGHDLAALDADKEKPDRAERAWDPRTTAKSVIIIGPQPPTPDWSDVTGTVRGPSLPTGGAISPAPVCISAGEGHCAAILADGSVRLWGSSTSSAILAAGSITAGGDSTCAIVPLLPPVITSMPERVRVFEGVATATLAAQFSMQATSSTPMTYQWKRGGANLDGQTMSQLQLSSVTSASSGEYTVVVANLVGATESRATTLEVLQPATFTRWQQELASGPEPIVNSGPAADPGQQGIPNLIRYALGMDPRQPSRQDLPAICTTLEAGKPKAGITFWVPVGISDVNFYLSVSTDLKFWETYYVTPVPGPIVNGKRQLTFYDPYPPDNATARFVRLRVDRATPSAIPIIP